MFTFWPENMLGAFLCRVIILFLLMIDVFLLKGKIIISKRIVLFTLILVTCQGISMLRSRDVSLDGGNIIVLITSLIFVSTFIFEQFREKFINLICFISCFSIITYVVNVFSPSFFARFPIIDATTKVANCFFSLVPVGLYNYPRNYGCSGEPGMFAVYVAVATLLLICTSLKVDIKKFALLNVAMVTTFSTSGYIAMVLIWGLFLFNGDNINLSKKRKKQLYFTVIIVGVAVLYLYSSGKLGNAAFVFDKLKDFSTSNVTLQDRTRSIVIAWKTIVDFFPTGSGWGYYKTVFENGNILVTTPLNWFAVYGLLYGLLMNAGVYYLSSKLAEHFIARIVIYFALLVLIVSQDFSSIYLIYLLVFFAIKNGLRVKGMML